MKQGEMSDFVTFGLDSRTGLIYDNLSSMSYAENTLQLTLFVHD